MDQRVDDHRQIALLAEFHGEPPPAPDWFHRVLACAPERSTVDADGTPIETLAWGDRGAPGLLLMHGNSAHADWWSFIAPFFAEQWRVAAFSFSGMGGSGRRAEYSIDVFKREALLVAEATGLFEGAARPVFLGHSFGATVAVAAAADVGERLRGAVFVDPPFRSPARMEEWRSRRANVPPRSLPNKVYPSLAAALARFRFLPPQTTEHPYLVDLIARRSLAEVEGGYAWRFDPELWLKMRWRDFSYDLTRVKCPAAFVHGERSRLMHPDDLAYMWAAPPGKTPVVIIPEAQHHMMVDQPLATVAAFRGLLAGWPA